MVSQVNIGMCWSCCDVGCGIFSNLSLVCLELIDAIYGVGCITPANNYACICQGYKFLSYLVIWQVDTGMYWGCCVVVWVVFSIISLLYKAAFDGKYFMVLSQVNDSPCIFEG